MAYFWYLRLYLSIESVFCHLLQRMARIEMDQNLKKVGYLRFHNSCEI